MSKVFRKVGCQRRVDQNQPVQLTHVGCHCKRGNAVKHAQRVALVQQLLQGSNTKSTMNNEPPNMYPCTRAAAQGETACCSCTPEVYLHIPLMQRARHNEDDVVNHVPVGAVVHELAQRLVGLRAHMDTRSLGTPQQLRQTMLPLIAPLLTLHRMRFQSSTSLAVHFSTIVVV